MPSYEEDIYIYIFFFLGGGGDDFLSGIITTWKGYQPNFFKF